MGIWRKMIWPFLSLFHRGLQEYSRFGCELCQRGGWIFSIPAVWVRSFDPQSINFGTLNVIQTKTCLYTNIDYIVWILSEKKRCFDTVFWYSSNVAGLKNSIKSSFKAGTWSIHNVFEYNYIIHMCYHVFEMIYKPLFFWHINDRNSAMAPNRSRSRSEDRDGDDHGVF